MRLYASVLLPVLLLLQVCGCTPRAVQVVEAGRARDCGVLVDALGDKEHWILEDAAVGAGQARCANAVPRLVRVLENPAAGPRARAEAAIALSVLNAIAALPKILSALQRTENSEERYWLVVAAGRFCTAESLAAVEGAARDGNVVVSKGARKVLLDCRKGGE
jgi:HEAT repeat protein